MKIFLLFIFEAIIVFGPVYYYIRHTINNLIYSIDSLSIISIFILQIYFNITLGIISFYIFKFIRIYLLPPFIPIISYVIIIFILPLDLSFGFCCYATRRELRMATQAHSWVKHSTRYLRLSRRYAKQSRILNTIAPLMDRSGRGGLYDSFTESARRLKNKAEVYENNAVFL